MRGCGGAQRKNAAPKIEENGYTRSTRSSTRIFDVNRHQLGVRVAVTGGTPAVGEKSKAKEQRASRMAEGATRGASHLTPGTLSDMYVTTFSSLVGGFAVRCSFAH